MSELVTRNYYSLIDAHFRKVLNPYREIILFAFFGGKASYKILTNTSDVDIIVVYKNTRKKAEMMKREKAARAIMKGYLELHKKLHLSADKLWPGEFLTEEMLKESLVGRGFDITEGKLYLIPMYLDYQCTMNRIYRYWWSFLLFSRFLLGSGTRFSRYKKEAWKLMATYLIYQVRSFKSGQMEIKTLYKYIINGGKAFVGITSEYTLLNAFKTDVCSMLEQACKELDKEGLINFDGSKITMRNAMLLQKRVDAIQTRVGGNKWKTNPFSWYTYFGD